MNDRRWMVGVAVALVIVALIWGAVSPTWAASITGNDLYEDCQAKTTNPIYYQKRFGCLGYINGVLDATIGPDNGLVGFKFCPADTITRGQVRDVVIKWLSDHPQDRDIQASILVVIALREAWPCP